ncbi:MAG: acyloxyacyl hydrolase, partial [Candidatus Melainabacteria bacterium]|nr:acyloxyacyl hydrolase [Candidatus Melainabacteria bacterium]
RSVFLTLIATFCCAGLFAEETPLRPSHLMVGPGVFDVDKTHPRALAQVEYRWEVNCDHLRPLAAFFITTDLGLYVCGGLSYDIFFGKRIVLTPSFSPGLYYHGKGKHLGFPLNFRSAIDLSYVFKNQGRLGIQFNHISNARMLWKNPGADSLYIFYAIPFPQKKKEQRSK